MTKLNGILTLVSDYTDIYIAVYIIMCVVIIIYSKYILVSECINVKALTSLLVRVIRA